MRPRPPAYDRADRCQLKVARSPRQCARLAGHAGACASGDRELRLDGVAGVVSRSTVLVARKAAR